MACGINRIFVRGSDTRGRQGPIPGSQITPYIDNSDNLLSSRPQTGIRSPLISGPRPSFLARSRRGSRSPASAGPIPARTLSGSCADAVRVDPELGACCGDASVLLVAGEDLCGAVVFAPRRCACGRPRRRDLATSLALRVQPRRGADPHAGKALAAEGYCRAQASRLDEA